MRAGCLDHPTRRNSDGYEYPHKNGQSKQPLLKRNFQEKIVRIISLDISVVESAPASYTRSEQRLTRKRSESRPIEVHALATRTGKRALHKQVFKFPCFGGVLSD